MEIVKIIRNGRNGECVYKDGKEYGVYKFNAGMTDKELKIALEALRKGDNQKSSNKSAKGKSKIQTAKEVKK